MGNIAPVRAVSLLADVVDMSSTAGAGFEVDRPLTFDKPRNAGDPKSQE